MSSRSRATAGVASPLVIIVAIVAPANPSRCPPGPYERASMIVTSNKPFSAWGEIFGDDAVATAMIDRLIHHADILSLKGDSYRLRGKDLGPRPGPPATPA